MKAYLLPTPTFQRTKREAGLDRVRKHVDGGVELLADGGAPEVDHKLSLPLIRFLCERVGIRYNLTECGVTRQGGSFRSALIGEPERKMENKIIAVVGYLLLCTSVCAQEQQRELRGGGHLLGETAEQFFSEGFVGEILRACQGKDLKSVSKSLGHTSKTDAKDYCAKENLARQQATSGTRLEYDGRGDEETMRADTFTFDARHLVRISMIYLAPVANVEGFHPKSYGELFAGLQEAYGPPSRSSSEPMLSAYGVKFDAHRAVWLGKENVISIIEQPGADGRTEIIAETVAEYERAAHAPKTANPLQ